MDINQHIKHYFSSGFEIYPEQNKEPCLHRAHSLSGKTDFQHTNKQFASDVRSLGKTEQSWGRVDFHMLGGFEQIMFE